MSIINFVCSDAQKEELKSGVWYLIKEHYLSTAFPNTNVKYDKEGKDVYRARLDELMRDELCRIDDTENGIAVEFDSTEDAGCAIAERVYGTDMGYSDEGLTYLLPLFKNIAEKFGDVCFEADTECMDKWVEAYNHYGYDGVLLTIDGVDTAKYELVMENMFLSPEEIAEKTSLPLDAVMEIISNN